MSYREYELKMKAYQLRRIDDLSLAVDQAFIHRAVMASKKGKPVVRSKSQIININELEQKVLGKTTKLKNYDRLMQITRNLEESRRAESKENEEWHIQ